MNHILCILFLLPGISLGQIKVLPGQTPPKVFAGQARRIEILFENPTEATVANLLRIRLYQASSATQMPVSPPKLWKNLTLLPHQTVVESLLFDYPAVRTETRFLVHWLADQDKLIGQTEVLVYPEDFLHALADFSGPKPIGVLDPDNQFKPLLRKCKVNFQDLEADAGFARFEGKLAILGPFLTSEKVPDYLAKRVLTRAREHQATVCVWLAGPGTSRTSPLCLPGPRAQEVCRSGGEQSARGSLVYPGTA